MRDKPSNGHGEGAAPSAPYLLTKKIKTKKKKKIGSPSSASRSCSQLWSQTFDRSTRTTTYSVLVLRDKKLKKKKWKIYRASWANIARCPSANSLTCRASTIQIITATIRANWAFNTTENQLSRGKSPFCDRTWAVACPAAWKTCTICTGSSYSLKMARYTRLSTGESQPLVWAVPSRKKSSIPSNLRGECKKRFFAHSLFVSTRALRLFHCTTMFSIQCWPSESWCHQWKSLILVSTVGPPGSGLRWCSKKSVALLNSTAIARFSNSAMEFVCLEFWIDTSRKEKKNSVKLIRDSRDDKLDCRRTLEIVAIGAKDVFRRVELCHWEVAYL